MIGLHVPIAEIAIGRRIIWYKQHDPRNELVVHLNSNLTDNRPENLSSSVAQQDRPENPGSTEGGAEEQSHLPKIHEQDKVLRHELEPRLLELESIIKRGLQSFYEVGMALLEIRDSNLYKQTHSNFEAYCQEKWGMKRNFANKTIAAATVIDNLKVGTNGTQNVSEKVGTKKVGTNGEQILPTNERQVRPLVKLPPETQREVWQLATKEAPNGRITADHIEKTIKKIMLQGSITVTSTIKCRQTTKYTLISLDDNIW